MKKIYLSKKTKIFIGFMSIIVLLTGFRLFTRSQIDFVQETPTVVSPVTVLTEVFLNQPKQTPFSLSPTGASFLPGIIQKSTEVDKTAVANIEFYNKAEEEQQKFYQENPDILIWKIKQDLPVYNKFFAITEKYERFTVNIYGSSFVEGKNKAVQWFKDQGVEDLGILEINWIWDYVN